MTTKEVKFNDDFDTRLKNHIFYLNTLIQDIQKNAENSKDVCSDNIQQSYKSSSFKTDEIERFLLQYRTNEEAKMILLQSQDAQQYFRKDLKQYSEFISYIIYDIKEISDFSVMKYENIFSKAIVGQEKFFKVFIDELLLSLIKLVIKLGCNNEVFEETSKIIHKCIFSGNLKAFSGYLNTFFESNENNEKFRSPKSVIKFVQSLYSKTEAICGYKLIFQSFSHYNNFNSTYKFFVVLLQILGFPSFNLNISKFTTETDIRKSLTILREIFDVFTKIQVESSEKINETCFIDFIRQLISSVISLTKKPNSDTYEILIKSIIINPLIIEPIINEIIVYTMLSDHTNLQEQYQELLKLIFELFSKLHRIQSFIAKLIPILKAKLEENSEFQYEINSVLPESCMNFFTDCITKLASWQVMNLFKTLLYHLNAGVLELEHSKDPNKLFFIEILSVLTCRVLASVRVAEHTTTELVVEKFVASLDELALVLNKFGTILLHRKHCHVLMRSYLNICYNWAEIYFILSYYSINNHVSLKRNENGSVTDVSYLHHYLTEEQWCLIFERIANFGSKSCKEIMQQLLLQKYKLLIIFESSLNDETNNSFLRYFSQNFDEFSTEFLTDKFIINHILPKLPTTQILNLTENILNNNIDKLKLPHIYDSILITNSMTCLIFKNINSLLKQKRKLDGIKPKTQISKIYSFLPEDVFLLEDIGDYLRKIKELTEDKSDLLDFKGNEAKICHFLEILTQLPIVYCSETTQKLLLLMLFALHCDFCNSNCDHLKINCENIIIGLVEFSKLPLCDFIESEKLYKYILNNFSKYNELFMILNENIFKNENIIPQFSSVISLIKTNLNDNKYLKSSLVILNILNKVKRFKFSENTKEVCQNYKSIICNGIVKFLKKKSPENCLIEPFACVLKNYLIKDEDGNLEKLIKILDSYIDFALNMPRDEDMTGNLLLFTTVLQFKSQLNMEDSTLKIWNCCKLFSGMQESEKYSQLIVLIIGSISNEDFPNVTNDLFDFTKKSIEEENLENFSKNLKIWTSVLISNVNPIKIKILQEILERLLQELINLLHTDNFPKNEIIYFQQTIIQTNLFLLTPSLIDLFLITPTILFWKTENFVETFNDAIKILENLLKSRRVLIMDRLPPYLQQYRLLLEKLCENSNSDLKLSDFQVQNLSNCSHNLEKLTRSLVSCTRDVTRIAPYLIADILAQYELVPIYPNVKLHLNNCLYCLISLCDQHAISYLKRALSDASTEIFKIMYENYKKYYRFTGKI